MKTWRLTPQTWRKSGGPCRIRTYDQEIKSPAAQADIPQGFADFSLSQSIKTARDTASVDVTLRGPTSLDWEAEEWPQRKVGFLARLIRRLP